MKKTLITGGKGLVGSSFKSGEKPSSKELNLFDYQESFNYIKKINPDIVIHCAARVGGLYDNMKNQADFFDQNVMINSNILKISKELKINKFIGFLSTCIFLTTSINHLKSKLFTSWSSPQI